jgi:hypothetical protein
LVNWLIVLEVVIVVVVEIVEVVEIVASSLFLVVIVARFPTP